MAQLDELDRANARSKARKTKYQAAESARFDARQGKVVVTLSSGVDIAFPPASAQGLEKASAADLKLIEISPSGLGLHFPKLDADIYLPALLDGLMGSRKWIAARLGAEGGKVKSAAKAAASRENGKRGGRPKKVA